MNVEDGPVTVSLWQQGCDDAKARKPRDPQYAYNTVRGKWSHRRRCEGYNNGYNFGALQAVKESAGEK